MVTFKHTHLSTRFDDPIDALRNVVNGYRVTSDIITLTEVDSERREKALRHDGWGIITGDKTGRDDCAILWDESVWKALHAETHNVTEYMAGNIGASIVVLEHKVTNKKLLVSVIHLPSSVEGNSRVEGGRRDEWYGGIRAWKARVNLIAKRYKVRKKMLVADWNLNLKRKWVQKVIKGLFPRWKFVWDLSRLPVGGTHGPRLIDFTILKGGLKRARQPRIHRSTRASDHRGYDELIRL